MRKGILILILIIYFSELVFAQTINDVEVTIILPDELNTSFEYTELFLVKNNNDSSGIDDNLSLNVSYTLNSSNETIVNKTFQKNINSYSKSGFGFVNISQQGNYSICVNVTENNYVDDFKENNYECKELVVRDYQEIVVETYSFINDSQNITINKFVDCNYSLNIYTTKQLFDKGETIEFKIYLNNDSNYSFPFPIDYWVEDVFGDVQKKLVSTTSKSEKRYTPKFDEAEKSIIIKANSINCSLQTERLVVLKGEKNERITEINIDVPESVSDRIFFIGINGYKGDTGKTLISVWVQDGEEKISEITKTYINNKNSEFDQKIPVLLKESSIGHKDAEVIIKGLDFSFEKKIKLFLEEPSYVKEKISLIKNLYVKKENFDNEIPVYLSIENPLDTFVELSTKTQTVFLKSETSLKTNINITFPDEKITAKLVKLIDEKDLKLNLKLEKKELTEDIVVEQQGPEEKEEIDPLITKQPVLKPAIKEKTPFFFFSITLIVIALLFGKNIINVVKKKTKLFK